MKHYNTRRYLISAALGVALPVALFMVCARANLLFAPTATSSSPFHAAANLGSTTGTTLGPVSYTVGSGSNRLLIVMVIGDVLTGANDCGGGSGSVTYNSVSMTARLGNNNMGNVSNRNIYLYDLFSPASGANNVVVTCGSSHFIAALAADYTGFTTYDAGGLGNTPDGVGGTSVTTSLTTTSSSDWVMGLINTDMTGGTSFQNTGSPTVTLTERIIDTSFHAWAILDSNSTVTSGSNTTISQLNTAPTAGYITIDASYH